MTRLIQVPWHGSVTRPSSGEIDKCGTITSRPMDSYPLIQAAK